MLKKITAKIVRYLLFPIVYIVMREIRRNYERDGHNLSLGLQRRANDRAAQYVELNMLGVDSSSSQKELLKKSFNYSEIDGLNLEFGVYSGNSINYLSTLTKEFVYGFDSFEGLPERWRDGFGKSFFKINNLPRVRKNVRLIKGWFDKTIPVFILKNQSVIRFLHIDCDLYSSTKTIFELIGSRIVPGTVIVFDEYFNYPGWEHHEFKAFQEFILTSDLNYKYIGYNRNHEQVAVAITKK
jgi:hypothetical protein